MGMLSGLNKKLRALVATCMRGGKPGEPTATREYFDAFADRPDFTDGLSANDRLELKERMRRGLFDKITHREAAAAKARTFRLRRLAAAAVLVISCSVVLVYWFANDRGHGEMSVGRSEQRELVLSDGTKIRLNSSSKLTYPASFAGTGPREVTLVGEAFFDVARDTARPFLIHTPSMEIRVLGTSFNVRDYDADATAETALLSGKVEVARKDRPEEKFYLDPNQKFTVYKHGTESLPLAQPANAVQPVPAPQRAEVKPMSADIGTAKETEWMYRRITVDDESLGVLSRRLERMYDVEIVFENESVAQQVYSATFDDEALENILKALQLVVPFEYRKEGNKKIVIH